MVLIRLTSICGFVDICGSSVAVGVAECSSGFPSVFGGYAKCACGSASTDGTLSAVGVAKKNGLTPCAFGMMMNKEVFFDCRNMVVAVCCLSTFLWESFVLGRVVVGRAWRSVDV